MIGSYKIKMYSKSNLALQPSVHQNQRYFKLHNLNFPPPPSQPDYEQVIQNQPGAHQPSSQGVADGWMPIPQVIPQNCPNGLEYLSTLDQLFVIQQKGMIEGEKLQKSLLKGNSNKKFTIENSASQLVYYAIEDNDCCTRNYWGKSRPFEMRILDNYRNEVIHLSKPLACKSYFLPFYLQIIEVFSPPGCLVGTIEHDWLFLTPFFTVRNAANEEVFKIKGPICRFSMCGSDVEFKILSKDKTTVVGRITKQPPGTLREFFINANHYGITFPMDLDVRMKAVMLGACYLIVRLYVFLKIDDMQEIMALDFIP
ncbi:phospholipid scramblase 2-like [Aphis craccivora]|uniref:Phospholipid scramblase n=1 Tax=Aphis craccivora TaxID=307492 RepID=A0A6G0YUI1_APHCR|nr:phospholipid scramblase 2-like [Aphis craccivora]